MKATGIVRRIDDLGRIVVPKEIRRTLHIREGDPLEIFTDREGEIIFKKYSPIGELSSFAQQFCESASQILNATVCVSDRDVFIAASGSRKAAFLGKSIHPSLDRFIEARKTAGSLSKANALPKLLQAANENNEKNTIATIICQGDAIGSLVIIDSNSESALTLAKTGAIFLGKQLEG